MSSKKVISWLRGYGYGGLVFLAIVGGVALALRTDVPDPVPNFALQAQAIYRIEIGLGSFFSLYLVSTLLVSALNGRGVTRLGSRGIRLQRIVNRKQQGTILRQERSIRALQQAVKHSVFAIQAVLTSLVDRNREIEARVDVLSERLRSFEGRDLE